MAYEDYGRGDPPIYHPIRVNFRDNKFYASIESVGSGKGDTVEEALGDMLKYCCTVSISKRANIELRMEYTQEAVNALLAAKS